MLIPLYKKNRMIIGHFYTCTLKFLLARIIKMLPCGVINRDDDSREYEYKEHRHIKI